MLKGKGGFTLIELVMIIVILGILAAVAIPRYYGLQEDARRATGAGWIGGLRSAISVDWAAFQLGKTGSVGTGVTTLAAAEGLLEVGSERPQPPVYQDGATGWFVDINGDAAKTSATDDCYAFTAAVVGPPAIPASVGQRTLCP